MTDPGPRDDLTDVPGFRAGSAEDPEAGTGCTVILCPPDGAVGGVDQRGGAPGTRETDPLRPLHLVERCHAVLLTGGSAFGLDAAGGVVRYLERLGVGFDTRAARVPIVPAAVLYDLAFGRSDVRPDSDMGQDACREAERGAPVRQGNAGAGCGATVGKIFGLDRASKGGLGSASDQVAPGLFVGAIAAVNAFGDVVDPASGEIMAGARGPSEGPLWADTVEVMRRQGGIRGFDRDPASTSVTSAGGAGTTAHAGTDQPEPRGTSTVLVVVATNARLDKEGANILALMAGAGMARTVRPVHTSVDGDIVFALAAGDRACDVNLLGAAAADVAARAIVAAVTRAESLHGVPCAREVRASRSV